LHGLTKGEIFIAVQPNTTPAVDDGQTLNADIANIKKVQHEAPGRACYEFTST